MTNHVPLDNIVHKDLRVVTQRNRSYGDNIASTVVFPVEFRRVQSEYPIVFRKNQSAGHLEPIAMLGLADGENLFLDDASWHARYIPLSVERQPFLIGLQTGTSGGVPTEEAVVYVDMDSPRISDSGGEAVFLPHGGTSPYLEHINSVLKAIHEGHKQNTQFSNALVEHDLIEPFTLEITLNDGSDYRLAGLHTIDQEKLNALDGSSLSALHSRGFLEHVYMVMASIANFSILIEKKNALLQANT